MIINFDNIGGGGGGGSYTLPVASANQLGGIKVGSGLTIDSGGTLSTSGGSEAFSVVISALVEGDFTRDDYAALQDMADYLSGRTDMPIAYIKVQTEGGEPGTIGEGEIFYLTYLGPTEGAEFHYFEGNYNYVLWLPFEDVEETTITTEGGAGGGDYMVVSGLPQSAQEGQLFYVPAHTEDVEYFGLTLTTQETENYVGRLYDGNDNEQVAVYISGTEFYWDWENDGEVHKKNDYYYKTDTGNSIFTFYAPDGWYVVAENDTETGTTDSIFQEISFSEKTYRANSAGTLYFDEGQNLTYLHFDWSQRGEEGYASNFANTLFSYEDFTNIVVVLDNYQIYNGSYLSLNLFCVNKESSVADFCGAYHVNNAGGQYNFPVSVGFRISPDGYYGVEEGKIQLVIVANIDSTSHALTVDDSMFFNRTLEKEVNYVFSFKGKFYNAYEHSKNHITFDSTVDGIHYHGEWSVDDGGQTLDNWIEEPAEKYIINSGLTGIGLSNANWSPSDGKYEISAAAFATITAETDLLEVDVYGSKMKVTTDGTDVNMYIWDGDQETYILQGTEGWTSGSDIDPGDMPYGMYISDISTGATGNTFTTNSHDYGPTSYSFDSIEPFKMPFAGLQVFDTSDNHLKVYNGTQWVQIA